MDAKRPLPDPGTAGPVTDRDYWDASWAASAEIKPIPGWHATWGRRGVFLSLMRRHVGRSIVDDARAIELGGAMSPRLMALVQWAGCAGTALDYSPSGLAATRAMFAAHGVGVDCVAADMFTYEAERPFDLVTHWGLIEHFARPEVVLEASARLVRPGGVVAFGMPNMRAWAAHLWRTKSPQSWSRHIYHSDEVIRDACAMAGLELTSSFHWHVPLVARPWESPERWLKALTMIQTGLYGVAKFLPVFRWGTAAVSCERAFVAIRR